MRTLYLLFLAGGIIAFIIAFWGSIVAASGLITIDFGSALFEPGAPNMEPFHIVLNMDTDTVAATAEVTGGTQLFPYDGVTGKGFVKPNEMLFALDVNEAAPSVAFTEYVATGQIFSPTNTTVNGGVIQGSVNVEGIPMEIAIDQNVYPWITRVSVGGVQYATSSVYSASNSAPFESGDYLYAVEPNVPATGMFQVKKWVRYRDQFTDGVYAFPSPAGNVSHLVISEVQLKGASSTDDFIELYNPTDTPIDLVGYRLVKRTALASTTDISIKSWTASTTIPAHGFYLWANSSYTSIAVVPDATTTATIADDNGIALRFGPLNTGAIIDSVAWGAVQNGFGEGVIPTSQLLPGQSYERKLWQGIACFSAQGVGELLGNGCDTNDNDSDFNVRSVSMPQNSLSAIEL